MSDIHHYSENDSLLYARQQQQQQQQLNFQQLQQQQEQITVCGCQKSFLLAFTGTIVFLILFVSSIIKQETNDELITAAPAAHHSHRHHHKNWELLSQHTLEKLNNLTIHHTITTTTTTDQQQEEEEEEEVVVPQGCESTVLIIRHCEDLGGQVEYKDKTRHCSYLGFQRSIYFASLFGNNNNNNNDNSSSSSSSSRWPLPSRLYGVRKDSNVRQYETLQPLSVKTGIGIQMVDFENGKEDVSNQIVKDLAGGQLCDKVVVIAWKHAYITDLASSLGCAQSDQGCPDTWDDFDFDSVWEIKYVYQPKRLRKDDNYNRKNDGGDDDDDDGRASGWMIYGSKTKQGFDPLAFSNTNKLMGSSTIKSSSISSTTSTANTKEDGG